MCRIIRNSADQPLTLEMCDTQRKAAANHMIRHVAYHMTSNYRLRNNPFRAAQQNIKCDKLGRCLAQHGPCN